jgi:hypothetical protein
MARENWSEAELGEAAAAKAKRAGMTRPLQLSDLSPRERHEAMGLLDEKNRNIKAHIAKRISGASTPAPSDVEALDNPKLKSRTVSLRQMSNNLVKRTEAAAAGPERLPGETLAGEGFYFKQRAPLAAVTDDVHTLALASSRLSPKTKPDKESRTAIALATAHNQQGTVHFTPSLVSRLNGVPENHVGRNMPFSQIHPSVVSQLRKGEHRDAAYRNSQGVDWDGMRAVGLDANVERAHGVLQGDPKATPTIFKNPKQSGYADSISEATPGPVEHEYKFRASHLGKTIRGEIPRGQLSIDTGLAKSNEGMLSNRATIAGDTWTRRATSGQHLDVAGPVADTFISSKGDVGRGDTRVTPVGIEHAVQQAAVEGAARTLQKKHGMESTIPSRLIQETGGWGQPRREAGGDKDFNAVVTPNRNVSQKQIPGQERLF